MISRITTGLLGVMALGVLPAARAQAQQNSKKAWEWSGEVPAGQWIRMVDRNGTITFGATGGTTVQVVATEHWRRGDPAIVRFDMQKSGTSGDVTVCALWGPRARCDAGSANEGTDDIRNDDVSVDFQVLVPRGVKVGATSVNGEIMLSGVSAEVNLSTVNGKVELTSSGGPIKASTVNGEVIAHVDRVGLHDDITLQATNGNVVADLPADLNADVELTTTNGSLKSDYDITMSGRLDPRNLKAHIGKPGGPRVKLTSTNGNVELRRR